MSELDADLYGGEFVTIPVDIDSYLFFFEQTSMAPRI